MELFTSLRKLTAVFLAGAAGVGAHFVPALDGIDPASLQAVSAIIAGALVYAVPNTKAGFNVGDLADLVLESLSDRLDDEEEVVVASQDRRALISSKSLADAALKRANRRAASK